MIRNLNKFVYKYFLIKKYYEEDTKTLKKQIKELKGENKKLRKGSHGVVMRLKGWKRLQNPDRLIKLLRLQLERKDIQIQDLLARNKINQVLVNKFVPNKVAFNYLNYHKLMKYAKKITLKIHL